MVTGLTRRHRFGEKYSHFILTRTLRAQYGLGNWRKKKGIANIRLPDGSTALAEVHWYEAHGIGKVKLKIKEWL